MPLEVVQPADPQIRTRVVERLHCPADLMAPAAQRPTVPPGAVITVNAAGKTWLAALSAVVDALLDQITDAQAACSAASVVDLAGLP